MKSTRRTPIAADVTRLDDDIASGNNTAPDNDTAPDNASNERGATLVLVAAVLMVLMGMAGFAVDLGWLYSQKTETIKAAEAAALAGVVHMPNPSSTPWGPGAEAFDVARDIAERNGHEHGVNATVMPARVAGLPNQLRVDTSRAVPTFFMKVFGINSVTVTGKATAERTPPLKIGSDEPQLGGVGENFFVAVNGTRRGKGSGDPYSTHCLGTAHDCSAQQNDPIEYRRPAYYYAVEVPSSEVGGALMVDIYDGWHMNRSLNDGTGEYGNNGPFHLTFRLFAPDATPAEPTDNTNVVCSRTFTETTDTSIVNQWQPLNGCPVAAELGIYVLEVDIIEETPNPTNGNNHAVSAFAIRSTIGGNTSNDTAVFGLGSMSLWMPKPGTTPTFKIVKLEEFYANTELILSLFDPGDLTGTGVLQIIGELAGSECLVRVRNADGSTKSNWGPDDGGGNCRLDVSNKEYNNEWVDLRFLIPSDYTCSSDCWVNVSFAFGGATSVFERTTWTAAINGLPVHLVP